ncbi:hypothetical protein [Streptomyces sioyaensis]|uniref:hypothetical protein n=1 Tax=Streptomyces sioyaensis TaxID=67364 RepID=UPI003D72D88C
MARVTAGIERDTLATLGVVYDTHPPRGTPEALVRPTHTPAPSATFSTLSTPARRTTPEPTRAP